MYKNLYCYFILNKELQLPGIGTFILQTNAASFEVSGKAILPPSYTVSLQQGNVTPSRQFFKWLAEALQISERDAVIKFNDFAFDLKKQVMEGSEIIWNGMGRIYQGNGGAIKFTSSSKELVFGEAVPVEKIIQENINHTVRISEYKETSDGITEIISHQKASDSYWWAYALIIGLLAVIFTGWHFSTYGVITSSSATQQKITPEKTAPTHVALQ